MHYSTIKVTDKKTNEVKIKTETASKYAAKKCKNALKAKYPSPDFIITEEPNYA